MCRRAAWRDADEGGEGAAAVDKEEEREEGEMMAEPGELPPEGGGAQAAAAAGELPPGFGSGGEKGEGGEKGKRKHAPIVWMTPPKVPKVDGAAGVGPRGARGGGSPRDKGKPPLLALLRSARGLGWVNIDLERAW